jgi:DNA (cytosine-5)-methyltransferase 1
VIALSDDDLLLASATRSSYAAWLAGETRDPSDLSVPRHYHPALLTSSLRTVHTQESINRFDATAVGDFEEKSRYYRLHPKGLSGTLRAGTAPDRGSFSAPRPIHPDVPRVITVREAARLSGFPDWFRFTAAKWHGFRQVGNAVPPPLARAVAACIREALGAPAIEVDRPIDLGDEALLHVASGSGRRPSKRRRKRAAAA